ncbi:MAG: hypothetical protein ACRC10_09695 [Thermoguttaceae bacterium]
MMKTNETKSETWDERTAFERRISARRPRLVRDFTQVIRTELDNRQKTGCLHEINGSQKTDRSHKKDTNHKIGNTQKLGCLGCIDSSGHEGDLVHWNSPYDRQSSPTQLTPYLLVGSACFLLGIFSTLFLQSYNFPDTPKSEPVQSVRSVPIAIEKIPFDSIKTPAAYLSLTRNHLSKQPIPKSPDRQRPLSIGTSRIEHFL